MNVLILYLFLGMMMVPNNCLSSVLTELRSKYIEASEGKQKCADFGALAEKYNNPRIVETQGYYACSKMMMAKYYFNPISRYSEFKAGVQLLEKAIQLAVGNVELIYLRYTIQTQVPDFLGYNKQIQHDKAFLLNVVNKLDEKDLKAKISSYLKYSKYVSSKEKMQLL